jgi:hypothetical protein
MRLTLLPSPPPLLLLLLLAFAPFFLPPLPPFLGFSCKAQQSSIGTLRPSAVCTSEQDQGQHNT